MGNNIDWNLINEYYQTHTAKETAENFSISKSSVKTYCRKLVSKMSDEERKTKRVLSVNKRRKRIKRMAVEYKGGSCEYCGYNKCLRALEFHHINPKEKEFSISYKGICRSWDRVQKELDKCIMLCANCHAELHDNIETQKS